MFLDFLPKIQNSCHFGKQENFWNLGRVSCLNVLGAENFYGIALFLTAKEIQTILCFYWHLKWPSLASLLHAEAQVQSCSVDLSYKPTYQIRMLKVKYVRCMYNSVTVLKTFPNYSFEYLKVAIPQFRKDLQLYNFARCDTIPWSSEQSIAKNSLCI